MTPTNPEGLAAPALTQQKAALRKVRRAARAAVSEDEWQRWDEVRTQRALELTKDAGTVAMYLSMPAGADAREPGTLELAERMHARGQRLLVPLLSADDNGPRHDPCWTEYTGADELVPGLWGIPEPRDAKPLGAGALTEADVVLCSALAATADGWRLGVGGGWFDRALEHARPDALLTVLVSELDLVDELPIEPRDRRMDVVVTEARVLRH